MENTGRRVVLLIEDDPDTQETWRTVINFEDPNCEVLQAMTVDDALLCVDMHHDRLTAVAVDGGLDMELDTLPVVARLIQYQFRGLILACSNLARRNDALMRAGCTALEAQKYNVPSRLLQAPALVATSTEHLSHH